MGKNKWEKLTELPEEYEGNPDLAKNAIKAIREEEARKAQKKGWWQRHWKKLTYAVAACVVFVGVFFPVYNKYFKQETTPTPPPIVYYGDETISMENVSDMHAYVQEKQIQVKYFSTATTISQCGIVTATQQVAYFNQNVLYINSGSFDQINLYAVVLQNATFEFEKQYNNIIDVITYQQISITYGETTDKANKKLALAKFTADNVKYYLEIQTSGEAEANVLQYVEMLMQS